MNQSDRYKDNPALDDNISLQQEIATDIAMTAIKHIETRFTAIDITREAPTDLLEQMRVCACMLVLVETKAQSFIKLNGIDDYDAQKLSDRMLKEFRELMSDTVQQVVKEKLAEREKFQQVVKEKLAEREKS